MNSLSRFLTASVCASLVVLTGCQSLGPRKDAQESASVPAAAGNPTRVAMTLSRPAVPEAAPLVLNRQLPEPRIVEVRTGCSIPEASLDQESPVSESGFHLPEPEVIEVIPFETPYFRKMDRGFPIPTAAKTADPPEAKPEKIAASVVVRPTPAVEEVKETHRELIARQGDQIGIDLEDRGWIYLGLDSGSGEGIDYLSSQYSDNKSSFSFKALEYGVYELSFQFQDNQNAVLRSQVVQIEVLPDDDFQTALELQQQGFVPEVPEVPEPGPRIDKVETLFTLESGEISSAVLEVARFQTKGGRYATAIEALIQYISRYPDGRQLDEVYYRLARIYEVDSPYRDLELSRDYYELLYDNFPESAYAERAGDRLNYLDRHFFLVQ